MPHNGGRTQVNSNALADGLWYFWNLFKQASSWSYRANPTDTNAPRRPVIELDADGYPTSIVAGTTGVVSNFSLFPVASYSGVYVITWDGGGTLLVPGNGSTTGFIPNTGYSFSNLTSGNGGGRFEFTLQNDGVGPSIAITATSASPNHIRNIKLFRKIDEDSGLTASNSVLGADFKAVMASCGFGVFRSLGWVGSSSNGTNDCDMAVWSDRTPRTHYSYRAQRFVPSRYAGRTTRSGNDYTVTGTASISDKLKQHLLIDSAVVSTWFNSSNNVTCSITNSSVTGVPAVGTLTNHGAASGNCVVLRNAPAGLTDGARVFLSVIDANTFNFAATRAAAIGGGPYISTTAAAASTQTAFLMGLSIDGGSTFKPMSNGSFPTSADVSIGFNSTKPAANTMVTVTYDQAIDYWHMSFSNNSDCGILSGCPPEVFIDACAELGAHPYIIAPFQSVEVGANVHSVTDFMPSWVAYIRDTYPWMKPIIEPPNEVWNKGSNAFRASVYAEAVSWARWGITASAIHEAYGKWTSTLGQAVAALFGNDRSRYSMLCAVQTATFETPTNSVDARLKSTQYVASNGGDPAYKWVDRVCASTYFNPGERFTTQELVDAYAYSVTYSGTAAQQSAVAEAYCATSGIGTSFSREYTINCIANIKAWAQGMPGSSTIKGYVAYEGGYSPDYLNGNWSSTVTAASKANPCVLTIGTTSSGERSGMSGNPAVVGMTVTPSSVGGMTQLNGNSYTVTKVGVADGLAGNQIAINVDSTGFGTYTSGGSATYANSQTYVNNLRKAGKSTYSLASESYKFVRDYYALASAGFTMEYFSFFVLAGTNSVWPMLDPNYVTTPRTYLTDVIRLHNNRKRRIAW
jgi:hypothetical protein